MIRIASFKYYEPDWESLKVRSYDWIAIRKHGKHAAFPPWEGMSLRSAVQFDCLGDPCDHNTGEKFWNPRTMRRVAA